jgi:hypothetical protein
MVRDYVMYPCSILNSNRKVRQVAQPSHSSTIMPKANHSRASGCPTIQPPVLSALLRIRREAGIRVLPHAPQCAPGHSMKSVSIYTGAYKRSSPLLQDSSDPRFRNLGRLFTLVRI